MFCVYFLKSLENGDLYIGSCQDLPSRLNWHNRGLVKSTKGYCPWKLLGFEEYASRTEAVKKERFYKTGQQKELLKRKFRNI